VPSRQSRERFLLGREDLRVPEELQPADGPFPECDRHRERNLETESVPGRKQGIAVCEGFRA
jgi:hypothetical protein